MLSFEYNVQQLLWIDTFIFNIFSTSDTDSTSDTIVDFIYTLVINVFFDIASKQKHGPHDRHVNLSFSSCWSVNDTQVLADNLRADVFETINVKEIVLRQLTTLLIAHRPNEGWGNQLCSRHVNIAGNSPIYTVKDYNYDGS